MPAWRTALRLLIAAVIAGGATSIVLGPALAGPSELPSPLHLGFALLAFVIGDSLLLDLRFGKDRYSFTGSEAAVVVALVLVPPAWAPAVGAAGIAAAHLLARRPLVKIAYNASVAAAGMGLAVLLFSLVAPLHVAQRPVTPRAWLALALGSAAFFLYNHLTVSAAVAWSQGIGLRTVARHGLVLAVMVCAGNTLMGVMLVALGAAYPPVLISVPFIAGLLLLSYRGYLRAMQERDAWEVLHATSGELLGLDPFGVARLVVERAPSLFRADFAELLLVDGSAAVSLRWAAPGPVMELEGNPDELAGTFWGRSRSEREPFELRRSSAAAPQRAELEEFGLKVCLVVPLVSSGGCMGTLRLGFRGNVKIANRELQVLTTFANHVASAMDNARLVETMGDERTKLSRIVDNSSDGILSIDGEGRILSWNRAMEALTGRSEAEAVGQPLPGGADLVTEDGDAVTPEWLQASLAEVDQLQVSVALRAHAAGDVRWLSVSISAVRSLGGDLAFAVLVARDVTATREVEEAKQDFVATVSHELRTPLTPLKGFLLTLQRPDLKLGDLERQSFYGRMLEQTERLERLIEDLLSISRMERGTFSIDLVPTAVVEIAERVVGQQRRAVAVRGRAGVQALADPQRVEQVLANLIDNADKYTPAGTPIEVEIATDAGQVVVRVRDHGPGIAEEHAELVFERFRRLGNHLTRSAGGTGLGLYIARRLVQEMGGRIWVESQLGEGATFTFTLPQAPASAEVQLVDPPPLRAVGAAN